ncbi:hypothetical protein [Nostoc favosum]|uniref:Uncharacterized protein n=1 Tax=Nostoc favosum CHAB5714 TaxID=2780399 RepID=A0ABS8IKF5_9NOSO|nr:hypothetical protein [Nostoc favosum]MCC5604334.1 hypothetical protein [Nostoc favosum CHAB5714]
MFYFTIDIFPSNGQVGTGILTANRQKEKHVETGVRRFLVSLTPARLQTKCISVGLTQLSQAIAKCVQHYH